MNTPLSFWAAARVAAFLLAALTTVGNADPAAPESADGDYLKTRTDLIEGSGWEISLRAFPKMRLHRRHGRCVRSWKLSPFRR